MSSHDHKDIDDVTGTDTTGHSWDGIKELNNPLPRWWLWIFYITIVWAIGYMILMPALPGLPGGASSSGLLNNSARDNLHAEMEAARSARAELTERLVNASLQEIETDRELQTLARAWGQSQFHDNCATCHGEAGRGNKGYPALGDDVWLWDGTLDGIEATLRYGIRQPDSDQTRFSLMPSFGEILTREEISDVTHHVVAISGQEGVDLAAAARGAAVFQSQCSSCHGDHGRGMREVGAPDLTDREWLFGGSPDEIRTTITYARNAHMPAWQGRLDDATIKALAVYVHTLGGGE
jgi:cytochrome c oxidase cbb3-type subunit III